VESCDWVEDDDDQIEINENFQMELKNILEKLKTDLNLIMYLFVKILQMTVLVYNGWRMMLKGCYVMVVILRVYLQDC